MTTNKQRAADVIRAAGWDGGNAAEVLSHTLADAGLLMPDIPDGLNLIGFERKGGGGGLLWDDRITTEALTKGYAAMFARLDKKELEGDTDE